MVIDRMPENLKWRGFTLIELLVVMAIVATLLSLVAPRYFSSLDKAKEAVLRQDLVIMRSAIDQFYSDTGKYPIDLEELVDKHYLRKVPIDPFTESNQTWIVMPPKNETESGVYDVHSGYTGQAEDGTYYEEW
ncbi:type II secretion system protein G (GspG) [Nitrosomonas ureae]|uniref:Type II secretion system protein G (GspG) n=2 Tax=Nitrosomonas ureae TaxID=44577 RepID=A0A1H9C5A0_9PROT|nr:type II secretion system protein G (GspG) [Nitrosomonas ureae]PXX16516.1 type II secretion system protein G (GspG) [Nitrosomonas ureae]SDT85935.1 type II secretion system protein G (GspG) [Nitrosomonas ureae]SEP95858.1 type II secretion system protein G (GspG) [Nitrosomonas ureae]